MAIENFQILKTQVDALERTLLSMNCLSNISAADCSIHLSDVSFLLAYLSDASLDKVNALREMIEAMPATAALVEVCPQNIRHM